jgi:hypothetical protein
MVRLQRRLTSFSVDSFEAVELEVLAVRSTALIRTAFGRESQLLFATKRARRPASWRAPGSVESRDG